MCDQRHDVEFLDIVSQHLGCALVCVGVGDQKSGYIIVTTISANFSKMCTYAMIFRPKESTPSS